MFLPLRDIVLNFSPGEVTSEVGVCQSFNDRLVTSLTTVSIEPAIILVEPGGGGVRQKDSCSKIKKKLRGAEKTYTAAFARAQFYAVFFTAPLASELFFPVKMYLRAITFDKS